MVIGGIRFFKKYRGVVKEGAIKIEGRNILDFNAKIETLLKDTNTRIQSGFKDKNSHEIKFNNIVSFNKDDRHRVIFKKGEAWLLNEATGETMSLNNELAKQCLIIY